MKNILLILLIGSFLISFGSAEVQSLEPIKLGEEINLIQTCASCTFNNITSVLDPNSFEVIGNFQMTRTGSVYNFTLSSDNITILGTYIVNGIGDLDGTDTIWNYNFEVTPSGIALETSDAIIYLILTVGSILLFLLCLYGGIILPFKNRRNEKGIISVDKVKYFKVGLLFLSYVLFVWVLNLLFTLSNNLAILTQYTGFFRIMFLVMNAMSYPIFVFMIILMGVLAWKDLQLKKLLRRGLNT